MSRISDESITQIKNLLANTRLPEAEIGKMYGVSVCSVSDINCGKTYPDGNTEYPIRKSRCTMVYSEAKIEICIHLLRQTDFSFGKIADMLNVKFSFVCDVNRGKRNYSGSSSYTFPIRKNVSRTVLDDRLVGEIVRLLKTSDMTADQIGESLGIPGYTVGQINRGKSSFCRRLQEAFPIRKTPHRNALSAQAICAKISEEELKEIIDLLINTSVSFEEIAKRYNISKDSVKRINCGETWKNYTASYKLPIRQNQKQNSTMWP